MSGTLDLARLVLKRQFGYDDFRPGQAEVVEAVLSGRDTLGVLPTGGGKSLCYQVPAILFPGVTIVISPLISLMTDQVDRLASRGIAATFLNSTLAPHETARRLLATERGIAKLLYLAPERFESPDLRRALARCTISLLAVDEAHCISEWGHEFRPSFRRIADVSEALGRPPVVALTATATPPVRRDIVGQLRMRRPRICVNGFDRPNLHYAVRRCDGDVTKSRALRAEIEAHERPAIVYATTRGSAERVVRELRRAGLRAAAYHGGLDGARRHEVQKAFMSDRIEAIVATNAFGMGIDKPNVRLVVHYAMPGTLEAYYQEAGRAGRDGLSGHCVLLYGREDRSAHEWFISGSCPDATVIEKVHHALRAVHVGGQVPDPATLAAACPKLSTRQIATALRFLHERRVLVNRGNGASKVRVRLLAAPARVERELGGATEGPEIGLLRALWRLAGASPYEANLVDLDALPPGLAGRGALRTLDSLRDRQFLDYSRHGSGLHLTDPSAPLEQFGIDWEAMSRRRKAEIAKLDMMERYARTTECRRGFVLSYFGERTIEPSCTGCDNCPSA